MRVTFERLQIAVVGFYCTVALIAILSAPGFGVAFWRLIVASVVCAAALATLRKIKSELLAIQSNGKAE